MKIARDSIILLIGIALGAYFTATVKEEVVAEEMTEEIADSHTIKSEIAEKTEAENPDNAHKVAELEEEVNYLKLWADHQEQELNRLRLMTNQEIEERAMRRAKRMRADDLSYKIFDMALGYVSTSGFLVDPFASGHDQFSYKIDFLSEEGKSRLLEANDENSYNYRTSYGDLLNAAVDVLEGDDLNLYLQYYQQERENYAHRYASEIVYQSRVFLSENQKEKLFERFQNDGDEYYTYIGKENPEEEYKPVGDPQIDALKEDYITKKTLYNYRQELTPEQFDWVLEKMRVELPDLSEEP